MVGDDSNTQWLFVSTPGPHSIISSAEILTPQLGTDARYQIEGAGEVLRSYSNNIGSKKLFLVRF